MPHFCKCGADEYICQFCGRVRCSKSRPSEWIEGRGNICPDCIYEHKVGEQFSTWREASPSQRLQHIRDYESKKREVISKHGIPKRCEYCGITFPHEAGYLAHDCEKAPSGVQPIPAVRNLISEVADAMDRGLLPEDEEETYGRNA